MEIRTTKINGKITKLYPAFNTEAHAHDIEFRYNRCFNEKTDMERGYIKWNDEVYDRLDKLSDQLDEILHYISYPVTYLPYPLYKVARDTIAWASGARK